MDWIALDLFGFKATFNIWGHIVAVSFIGGGNWSTQGKTADLRQVTDVLPNMHTCIHVCSGWRHVIISTVL